ncbi:hypothetical protein ARMSODRAFT_957323 [Armillaria solidipes]|uniref:Uncharacterized protein n=1 Tax=Armillaria solidipes TaxID=1076256 RepID=A0A2H3BDQ7_9AGAR|nr:hypothetical protein ARMSODRAFT_957323 [Armillaria solidipes]
MKSTLLSSFSKKKSEHRVAPSESAASSTVTLVQKGASKDDRQTLPVVAEQLEEENMAWGPSQSTRRRRERA